ncbi:MAG: DUF2974 domain-containing protein [Erysipelotrichaceae bacterium]|nr:DUF2974 domain-containing protein [Erysipelotrichaceae bacterium]
MANILDYIEETKDISFKEVPFNDVDGLVLSQFSYTVFDGILNENSNMSIIEANDLFWQLHTEKECLKVKSFNKLAPFVMKKMVESKRFKDIRIKNYINDISIEEIKQTSAMTLELSDGSDFVAFRGTDGTLAGWLEDFKFSFSTTNGQNEAAAYLKKYLTYSIRPLRIGGHSKGGNLAVYAALFSNWWIRRRIKAIYSYDGPGFKEGILSMGVYENLLPLIHSIIPEDCVVGAMMYNKYNHKIVKSDKNSVYQHDAYSWLIEDGDFIYTPNRSDDSLVFENVLNKWMKVIGEEKREKILNTIWSIYTDESLNLTDDVKVGGSIFQHLIVNVLKLDEEDRRVLAEAIGELLSSTKVVVSDKMRVKIFFRIRKIEKDLKLKRDKEDEKDN